ncbi:MAG: hypothetical protein KDK97_12195 [Verrucomicrobiales bacterium]|nr:hypothetical protein [Verrucomicrobiales bacterium]MCP5559761.1 hypothetical protein [Verrucomicrobiaceae bacterium]
MSVPATDLNQRPIPAFPPWLDLPPGYIVNDWIAWQKGKLVAARLRAHPEDVQIGIDWLESHRARLSGFDLDWLKMLQTRPVEEIAELIESPSPEAQQWRSGMPFKGEPFVTQAQMEAIRERAYAG